jgi:uncharacterized membrane protein
VELWQLFAHRHWITIKVSGNVIRLCARCSGTVLGFFSVIFYSFVLPFNNSLPPHFIVLCVLLAMPTAIDWLTQTWRLRESSNRLRLFTGFLEGVGVALVSFINIDKVIKYILLISLSSSVIILGYSVKRFKGNFNQYKPKV